MEVPCVQRQQLLARHRIAHVVFRRPRRVAFRADAKELRLHGVQMHGRIQRLGEERERPLDNLTDRP